MRSPAEKRLPATYAGKPSPHSEAERVRAAPFDAIELDLSVLWAK